MFFFFGPAVNAAFFDHRGSGPGPISRLYVRRETLVGETVLVTGGAQGIGRQVVLRALKLGAKVIVWDCDAAAIEQLGV